MKPLDPRLLRYARATGGYLVVLAALGTASALLVLAQAHLLARAIAGTVAGELDRTDVSALLLSLFAVVAARAALAWLGEGAAVAASAQVKSALRQRVLRKVLALGPTWLAGERSSSLGTLVTTGLDALDAYFARYLPQLVLAVTVPGLILAQLFAVDLLAAITVAATLPLIPVFMALIGMATNDRTRRRWRALSVLSHHFADVVAGLPTLTLFNRAKAQAAGVRRISDAHRRQTQATLRVAFLSALALEVLATLSVALVAVGIGVRVVHGDMGLELALLLLILAPEAYLPWRLVGTHFHASADGLAAADEAFRVLEAPAPEGQGTRAVPELDELRVRSLTVSYPERTDPAVTDVSFVARPGEVIALRGPSGAGKSTVVSALLGFSAPASGQILVGSVDLRELEPAGWRGRIAWVPQRPHLLDGTVADNVALGEPRTSRAQIEAALQAAGAPGLDPSRRVGERGRQLSAGEARRVALARAWMRATAVPRALVLLDEPSAGLDAGTEEAVVEVVRRLRAAGHLVVLVAHRLALLELADKVVAVGEPEHAPVGAR